MPLPGLFLSAFQQNTLRPSVLHVPPGISSLVHSVFKKTGSALIWEIRLKRGHLKNKSCSEFRPHLPAFLLYSPMKYPVLTTSGNTSSLTSLMSLFCTDSWWFSFRAFITTVPCVYLGDIWIVFSYLHYKCVGLIVLFILSTSFFVSAELVFRKFFLSDWFDKFMNSSH